MLFVCCTGTCRYSQLIFISFYCSEYSYVKLFFVCDHLFWSFREVTPVHRKLLFETSGEVQASQTEVLVFTIDAKQEAELDVWIEDVVTLQCQSSIRSSEDTSVKKSRPKRYDHKHKELKWVPARRISGVTLLDQRMPQIWAATPLPLEVTAPIIRTCD